MPIPIGVPIAMGVGSLFKGLFGGRSKPPQQQPYLIDTRQPPTIVDAFSQLGFAPQEKDALGAALAPLLMGLLFGGLTGQGGNLGGRSGGVGGLLSLLGGMGALPKANDGLGPFNHLEKPPASRISYLPRAPK